MTYKDYKTLLENEPKFTIFLQALNNNDEIVIRKSLYEGIFKEYVGYLNNNVTWDIELLKYGIKNIELENLRILDIGCGDGRVTRELSKLGELIVGVDISEEQISKAKSLNNNNIHWICADVTNPQSIHQIASEYDINIVVSSAASINCFLSSAKLKKFFTNIYQSIPEAIIFLPVFDQDAKPFFESNFTGGLGIEYFVYQSIKLQALFGMKFIKEKNILLQPTLIVTPTKKSHIQYEFCLSIDRIWDNQEVAITAKECGLYIKNSIDDKVSGGGANQFGFKLLELRRMQ